MNTHLCRAKHVDETLLILESRFNQFDHSEFLWQIYGAILTCVQRVQTTLFAYRQLGWQTSTASTHLCDEEYSMY